MSPISANRQTSAWVTVQHSQRQAAVNPDFCQNFRFTAEGQRSAVIAASPAADIEKNARALLASFFTKLDLVTREEFEVQTEVLRRTREKLKALEARVERLEAHYDRAAD